MKAIYLNHDVRATNYEAGFVECNSLFLGLFSDDEARNVVMNYPMTEDDRGHDIWLSLMEEDQ